MNKIESPSERSRTSPGPTADARSGYFAHEYDLSSLTLVRPAGTKFDMFVTPRYRQHYEKKEYECYTGRLVSRLAARHSLFLDVGANYGYFTFLAATANPRLKAYLLEPVAETIEAVKRTRNRLGLANVHLFNAAASDFDGKASFNISLSADNCAFAAHPSAPPVGKREVPVMRLDTLLAAEAPVPLMVKIDVEGHELSVLRGMSGIFSRFTDLTLIVECNPKVLALSGAGPEALWEALDELGFAVFFLDDDRCRHYRIKHKSDWPANLDLTGYANLYCRPKEQALSVCLFSHSACLAGAERSLLQLVTELTRDHGALCSVVIPGEGPLHRAMTDAGAAVIRAEYDWWGVAPPKKPSAEALRTLQPQVKALARKVLPYISQIDPDVIWSQSMVNPWGAVAAALLGKPHVWSVCEFGQLDYGIQFVAPFERVLQDVLHSSDLVYVNSRKVQEALFPRGGAKCRVLYRHIEIPENLPEGGQTGLFRRPGALRLGVFASLRESKGQEDAINAVAELVREGRNVELVLAGYGEATEESRLGGLIKTHRLEEHVHLTGFVQEVLQLMGETDVILFCSRNEAFGRVGVEAMLLGKPVVYADCLEYMIDGKTGLSYPVGDAAALAAGIRRLMDRPEERARLGAEAQRYARSRFTAEAYGGEVYKALSALRKTGSPGRVPSVLQDFITPEMAELIKVNPDQLDRESSRLTTPEKKKKRSRHRREAGDLLPSTLRKIRKFLNRQQRSLGKRKLELTALVDELKVRLSPGELSRLGRQPRLIALSGLFDEAWYRAANSERVLKRTDAISHYLRIGAAMGLDPNPLFDSKWYRQHTPGIPAGMNPLVHYILYGRKRGAKPNAHWDPALYLEANPDAGRLKDALRHYLSIGIHDDRLPEPVPGSTFAYEADPAESSASNAVRVIAFHLPQFHRIPENDQWWGDGFTEWTNVRGAEPQFHGHYQPHEPHADVGYYDLTEPSVMVRQAEMARRFGIHGFCFHHYWFGGQRLLEKPVEHLLQTGKPDFPFCLCWANENWTRRWDGAEHELLIAQNHSAQDDQRFILDVIRFFRDPRYIRISGKPLLIIYRPSLLPNPRATFSRWRKVCQREGIGEIYLAGAQSFGFEDPRPFELDAAVEFPPHAATVSRVKPCNYGLTAETEFNGLLYCYRQALLHTMSRRAPAYKAFPAVMPSWDNTARLKKKGRIFVNSSPRAYYSWLRHAVMEARSRFEGDERLVFINAWNEWAEGCHLEPDERYGFAWLNTTSRALLAAQSVEKRSKEVSAHAIL